MAYSIQREVSDGTLQTLTLRIAYFKKEHIAVYVDDKLADGTVGRYSWAWDGDRIKLSAVVPSGIEVMLRRITPRDAPFHNFRQGAVFKDVTMDENFIQQLYINQEMIEGAYSSDFYQDLDLHNYRVKNLGTALHPTDAISLGQYQADANGAYQQRLLAEAAKDAAEAVTSFTQTGTGAVTRTAQDKMRESVSVKDFGAEGDGVTDDTAAIQKAVNAAVASGNKPVFFPASTYLITGTIYLPMGSQLRGETAYQYNAGFGVPPKATTLKFNPTSLQSLFVFTGGGDTAGFRFHCSIDGFHLIGNSTTATGNSLYALDIDYVIYAKFTNLSIEKFRAAIRCNKTINNRFCNVYASGKVTAVLYSGGNATTDVWEQCSFWGAPTGVTFEGSNIGIRFDNCLFEQLDNYGMVVSRECQSIMVANAYSEDVPYSDKDAGAAMFKVGYDTANTIINNHLIISGGQFNGRNAGRFGAFLDVNHSNSIILGGCTVNRFETVIKTDSVNTRDNSIITTGFVGIGWGSPAYSDGTVNKLAGIYPLTVLNSGNSAQGAKFSYLDTYDTTATILRCSQVSAGGTFYPSGDNVTNLGVANSRWAVLYAGTGAINTSDQREKSEPVQIDDAVIDAWGEVQLIAYQWLDSIRLKGEDGARWHFGVIAQQVRDAFTNRGLDGTRYGLLCYDEWDETPEVLDEEGNVTQKYVPAGNRWGIRADQCLFLESAYQRRQMKRLEERLTMAGL